MHDLPTPAVTTLPHADVACAERRIFIRGLKLNARIGVHSHEQGRPQTIRVDLDVTVRDPGRHADRLGEVVCYEAIATRTKQIVADGHVNLAETLAARIAAAIFEDPRATAARVRIEKSEAFTEAEGAGVDITWTRQA